MPVTVFAAPTIKINSFQRISDNLKNYSAEVCGSVSGVGNASVSVELTVDEKTKNPATYMTWTSKKGNFCSVVTTYAGTIVAKINGDDKRSSNTMTIETK